MGGTVVVKSVNHMSAYPSLAPSFLSESSDQPDSRQLVAEAFPARSIQLLTSSARSGSTKSLADLVEKPAAEIGSQANSASITAPLSHASAQQPPAASQQPSLTRYDSGTSVRMQKRSFGSGMGACTPVIGPDTGRGGPERSPTSKRTAATVLGGGAVRSRVGTGSTPAPLRNTNASSPRYASPPQTVMKYRSSQPPPVPTSSVQAVTAPSLGGSTGAPVSSTLPVWASTAAGAGATLGGGPGSFGAVAGPALAPSYPSNVVHATATTATATSALLRPQERRLCMSPRF